MGRVTYIFMCKFLFFCFDIYGWIIHFRFLTPPPATYGLPRIRSQTPKCCMEEDIVCNLGLLTTEEYFVSFFNRNPCLHSNTCVETISHHSNPICQNFWTPSAALSYCWIRLWFVLADFFFTHVKAASCPSRLTKILFFEKKILSASQHTLRHTDEEREKESQSSFRCCESSSVGGTTIKISASLLREKITWSNSTVENIEGKRVKKSFFKFTIFAQFFPDLESVKNISGAWPMRVFLLLCAAIKAFWTFAK